MTTENTTGKRKNKGSGFNTVGKSDPVLLRVNHPDCFMVLENK